MSKVNTYPATPATTNGKTQLTNHTGELLSNELEKLLAASNLKTRLTKRERVIVWLTIAARLELKVTRFDAEWIGDHCFNTTISEITNIDHIIVDRIPTKRPTRFGKSVDCKEYWLQGNALDSGLTLRDYLLNDKSNRGRSEVEPT